MSSASRTSEATGGPSDPRDPEDPELELLGLLADELTAGGMPAATLPRDEGIPAQLVVPLGVEPEAPSVHVCFLPLDGDPPVLQYLVALDHDVAPEAVATTARFLHQVNATLPLTGFELSETAAAVVFRHVQAVSIRPLDPGVVAWPLSMIFHAVTRFDALVAQAAAGARLTDLIAGFGRVQAELFAAED